MTTDCNNSVNSDEIRVRGVRCQGYGQIPKIVMLCSSLSIDAKGIYAYFCSYTGSGNSAFPSRDHILNDLNMSKDAYYKHFKTLISLGLISVESVNGGPNGTGYKHNIYTIEEYAEDFLTLCENEPNAAMAAAIKKARRAGSLSAAGYGNVPKSIMLTDISVQAKALYAYFVVFSGEDYMAAPAADDIIYHLHISRDSFNKYTRALVSRDYLSREQETVNGHFGRVNYYLNQRPGESKPKVPKKVSAKPTETESAPTVPVRKIPDRVFSDKVSRDRVFSDKVSRDRVFSDTVKQDTNSTNLNITNSNITNINHSPAPHGKARSLEDTPRKIERAINYNRDRQAVTDELNTENGIPYAYTEDLSRMTIAVRLLTGWDERNTPGYYQGLDSEYQFRIYRMFVDALAEMMTDGHPTNIKGAVISYAKVFEKVTEDFLRTEEDCDSDLTLSLGELPDMVVNSYIRAGRRTTITNVKSYMKSIIWTELQGNDLWIETLADHDMHTHSD